MLLFVHSPGTLETLGLAVLWPARHSSTGSVATAAALLLR
jgi:hypothetical protein